MSTRWIEQYDTYIKNYSIYEIRDILQLERIPIEQYTLVCICKINGKRTYHYYKILGCYLHFLRGIHKIEWRKKIYCIPSVTTLKRRFFQTDDPTSVERCSYIIAESQKVLIRLKQARLLIQCPMITGSVQGLTIYKSPEEKDKNKYKRCKVMNEQQFKFQIIKKLEDLLFLFYKFEHNSSYSLLNLTEMMNEEIQKQILILKQKLQFIPKIKEELRLELPKKEVVETKEEKEVYQTTEEDLDEWLDQLSS